MWRETKRTPPPNIVGTLDHNGSSRHIVGRHTAQTSRMWAVVLLPKWLCKQLHRFVGHHHERGKSYAFQVRCYLQLVEANA